MINISDDFFRFSVIVIAICTVIRVIQNTIQLHTIKSDAAKRDNAYSEFIQSLRYTDKEFVKRMLKEFENIENKEEINNE